MKQNRKILKNFEKSVAIIQTMIYNTIVRLNNN